MKPKPNPYVKIYKKLHREKVKRKNSMKKLTETYKNLQNAYLSLAEIANRNRLYYNYLSNILDGLLSKQNKNDDFADASIYALKYILKKGE